MTRPEKTCGPVPCSDFQDEVFLSVEEWVPTLAEVRQAGAAIMQPDGSYYVEKDGRVVKVDPS